MLMCARGCFITHLILIDKVIAPDIFKNTYFTIKNKDALGGQVLSILGPE